VRKAGSASRVAPPSRSCSARSYLAECRAECERRPKSAEEPGWRKRLMFAHWTDRRLNRLKLLSKEGFSATIIAGKLGPAFTKGIVLRKLHLVLGAARPEGAKKRPARKSAKAGALSRSSKDGSSVGMVKAERVKASPPVQPLKPAAICLVAPAPSKPSVLQGIRLFDLRDGHCRWPLGDERPARLFCGAPSVGTTSWCEHHQRMAFSGTWRPAASPRLRVR